MDALIFNLTTAALMVLMFKAGTALVGQDPLRRRPIPWAAVALTVLAIAAVVLQHLWSGAMGALDDDPSKSGWWRVLTSVFMQNGGIMGVAWNIATLAVIAALAQWFWRSPVMLALFLAGILLPQHIDALFGQADRSTDPRNFAGSSGATYFLGSTLAAGLLWFASSRADRLLALSVPVLGLALWIAQSNGHGLVAVYGFALGAAVVPLARRFPRFSPAPAPAGAASQP
ncbi:hypothetical protein [Actinomadura opuntiae]|uniref:hypothetical protein n=1 Tax=Actinomadura sp. OS1-43 TaxID=604315 RepID=UPI00255B1D3D|nr:hypothetical protein [Actinomadura sp. OS1-43]MDL4820067.1 hypothetical protein [Actinomadura sp. OS1-43]